MAFWADPQIWSGQCTTHVLARIVSLLSTSPSECGVFCRDTEDCSLFVIIFIFFDLYSGLCWFLASSVQSNGPPSGVGVACLELALPPSCAEQ